MATALLRTLAFPSFDLFATGLPAVLPLFCFLVPESPGGLLGCVSCSLGRPGSVRFPSFLSLDRVGEIFLSGALVPLLCLRSVWLAVHPLPFLWLYRLSSIVARYVSLQFRALSRPLTMSWPAGLGSHALSWIFLCSLEISRCPLDLHSPLGVVALFPQGVTRDLCVPFGLDFLVCSTSFVLSLPLQSCAWFALPLRPGLLWRRCWISAPRFEGFVVPAVQTQAQSHWETVRSSEAVRFSLTVTTPHRLRCGRLFFPAGLSMKEFSIFSVSFWLRMTISRSNRLSWWSFPVLPLEARLPWVSLRVVFAEDVSCCSGVEGGFLTESPTFLLNYMRVLTHRSLETFHLGFVVLAFGPGFHLGRSPDIPALLGLLTGGRLLCLFSGPPSVPVEMPLSKGWYSPLMLPLLLDLLLTCAPSTFLPELGSRVGGEQASFHVAWHLPPLGLMAPDYFTQVLWQSTSRSPPSSEEFDLLFCR